MVDVVNYKGKLEGCVFCGTAPEERLKGGAVVVVAGSQYQVECLKIGFVGCGARGSLARNPEKAAEAWNKTCESFVKRKVTNEGK